MLASQNTKDIYKETYSVRLGIEQFIDEKGGSQGFFCIGAKKIVVWRSAGKLDHVQRVGHDPKINSCHISSPLMLMTFSFREIFLPEACTAFLTMNGRPEQQGTSITTVETLFIPAVLKISVNLAIYS